MAGALLQVCNLGYLPTTTPLLTLSDLQDSLVPLADRLIDRSRPPEGMETRE